LGSTGLFGVVLKPIAEQQTKTFLESLQLFAMGASWGGFESLIRQQQRHPSAQIEPGVLLRLHVGLEAVEDLIADLQQGLQHLNVTPRSLP
ncbi:PLP-dependent transferase, partial [Pseudomonas sp. MAFF 301449]